MILVTLLTISMDTWMRITILFKIIILLQTHNIPSKTVNTHPNTHAMPNIPPIPTRPPPFVDMNTEQANFTQRIVPGERLYSQAHNRVEHRGTTAVVEQINQGSANRFSTHNNVVSDIIQNLIRAEENSLNPTSTTARCDVDVDKWLRPAHLRSSTETTHSNS